MTKWVEYFIARRTSSRVGGEVNGEAKGANHRSESSTMSRVATLAVSLSVAVMILTLSIILGFKDEVRQRLTLLSGDVIVCSTDGIEPSTTNYIYDSPTIPDRVSQIDGVERINPFVLRGAVINSSEGIEEILLKGVNHLFDRDIIERGLLEGAIPRFGDDKVGRGAVISEGLATSLRLKVGDRLELLVYDEGQERMRRDLYRVGAIYTRGLGDAERGVVMVDMGYVQRLNSWSSDQISGYEISLSTKGESVEFAERINDLLPTLEEEQEEQRSEAIIAFATDELYPSIFDWLSALDMNGVVVLSIMGVVAIFNIITAILILVLERMSMVGVLKSLGMRNSSISNIFLIRALSITLKGLLWGNGVAIALALVQRHTNIIRLDEAGYLLDAVPIDLSIGWLTLLNVGVVVAILLSVALPTNIVSRIEPHKAIKFQ